MMQVILHLYHKCQGIVARQVPLSQIIQLGLFDKVIKIKYDVPNDKLEMLDDYINEINQELGRFLNTDYRKGE